MYDLVYAGDWTIDKEMELSTGVYTDTNGNGSRDKEDLYALSTSTKSAANAYLWALGKKIATQQPDGTYEISYFDEKMVSVMEKLYQMYYETDQVFFEQNHLTMTVFEPGQALFADGMFGQATSTLREVEFDYGIIPYPKWDTAQTSYYTSVDGGHEGLAVVRSITDPEFVGTILEVLCAESWKKTVPAYYDTALKYKGARDYESIAKDLVRIHQENWGSGAYVRDGSHLDKQFFLEFDHDAEDMGLTVLIYVSHPGDE